jgi:hypothetical protein
MLPSERILSYYLNRVLRGQCQKQSQPLPLDRQDNFPNLMCTRKACFYDKRYLGSGLRKVVWIGIVLMPIQTRIGIRIGIKNADPHADPTRISSMLENLNFIFTLRHSIASLQHFFPHQCHNFQYFGQLIEIVWK